MNNNKVVKYLRWIVLTIVLIFITIQAYFHQLKGGAEAASIHALCPYGGLESLYTFFGDGSYIQKIFSGTMVIFIITIVIATLFRRSFCGLICPFGALQELFGYIGKKVFRKRYIMPSKIDKPLRYLKYVVLLITVYYAWKTAGLWMAPYDPWSVYGHLTEGIPSVIEESLIGFILLIITIIGSILYERFFCKYLCPMGAFYAIISKISLTKIVRDENKCINCNLCSKNCPVNIDVSHSKFVTSFECISCQRCVTSCPKSGALQFKFGKKAMQPLTIIIIVVSLFFGGILLSKSIGVYQTIPKPITSETTISIDEIKGYMTIKDVSNATKIDIKELYKKLEIPSDVPENTKFKEIKNYVPGFTDEKAKEVLKK